MGARLPCRLSGATDPASWPGAVCTRSAPGWGSRAAAGSGGAVVARFLESAVTPEAYVRAIEANAYSGFNLLAADGKELWWMSNRAGAPRQLEPGVYGRATLLLDSPDVEANKARFGAAIELAPAVEPLFTLLAEARIVNPQYGTRCSTIYLQSSRTRYAERTFSPDGAEQETVQFEL